MLGHVMPSFPHTLIGLGPFANQGCKIVFDKTPVAVFHPNNHPILKGWQDLDGPRLWQFPLTASPTPPVHAPLLALVSAEPSATMLEFQPHPSQSIQATSAAMKKYARSYSTYLHLTFWLKGRSVLKIPFASVSQEFCVPGGLYFGYSMFPGVMLASSMHSPESLFLALQQLSLALDLNTTITMIE